MIQLVINNNYLGKDNEKMPEKENKTNKALLSLLIFIWKKGNTNRQIQNKIISSTNQTILPSFIENVFNCQILQEVHIFLFFTQNKCELYSFH